MLPATRISPPITLLHEICARNGLTASYQLLSTEGSVHEPTFKFAVTVSDVSAIASGQSKKKARHAAAREIIEKLRKKTDLNFEGINFDSMAPPEELSTRPTSKDDSEPADGLGTDKAVQSLSSYAMATNETNPVGKLQEICMKMRVNPPDYYTFDEKGLAHERVFYMTCSIASLSLNTMGQGRSKKLAKRQAAELMLTKLESTGIYDKNSNNKENDQSLDSLLIDADDNAHFVKHLTLTTELLQSLDIGQPKELWQDIQLIEQGDNDDIFYELIHDTIPKDYTIRFDFVSDTHCLLHCYDSVKPKPNLVLTTFGRGENNLAAMKAAAINGYKQLLILLDPLTGKENHSSLPVVGNHNLGLHDAQVATET